MFRLTCLVLVAAALSASALEKKGTDQHLWADTEMTTQLWRLCSQGKLSELEALIEDQPDVVRMRSSDGRGPLWWATEHKHHKVYDMLVAAGADPDAEDIDGKKPVHMGDPDLADYVKAELEATRQMMDALDASEDDEDEYSD